MNRLAPFLLLVVLTNCGTPPAPSAGLTPQDTSSALASDAKRKAPLVWTSVSAVKESVISGGPWTLGQSGASSALPSAGYCIGGVHQSNPGTELMQPYYFPQVVGQGAHLQGFFDYRPQGLDEAIVAAASDDFGLSWRFQDQALELTRACPASDAETNAGDDGQGHPFVATLGGVTSLYTLDRSVGNVDSAGLAMHTLQPQIDAPLASLPASIDASVHTAGLLSPDGIIAAIPGTNQILYLQKQLGADASFPSAQQCAGKKANHDITTPRLAQSEDGVNFTDLGPLTGLNDATNTTVNGTRWIGPRGTLILLAKHRYGLFFSGGSCADNDSDALHYIGYAESSDLQSWQVVNGFDNPIVAINSEPAPAVAPVIGEAQGWFAGRVYAPNVSAVDARTATMIFAGYHTQKAAASNGDYRSIGQITLRASKAFVGTSE